MNSIQQDTDRRALDTVRYEVRGEIGRGSMGVVYRAYDRLTQRMVALKQVGVPTADLLAATDENALDLRVALAQEFRTLAALHHPNIISVLDYGFHGDDAFYTMELLEDAVSILDAAEGQPLAVQADYLMQALEALAYLHRRSIVHRDLKPDNLLVKDGVVKVLDFGLAIAREYLSDEHQQADAIGTIAYMAPEVVQGAKAGPAADLHAIGVIAYELFIGRYPFRDDDVAVLITSLVGEAPSFLNVPLPADLITLLKQLLAKDPYQRPPSAHRAMLRLQASLGDHEMTPRAALHESYLDSPDLIGREAELRRLVNALERTVRFKPREALELATAPGVEDRPGSFWLIGGESGVGKTRLVDELRVRGQVRGALVLRGQASRSSGTPVRLWQPVLRELCLHVTLDDHEADALRLFVPDIEALLGRSIPEVASDDWQAEIERIYGVVEAVLARVARPLLILLEDLHWVGRNVELLRRVIDLLPTRPVMVVATYRDDEAPDLPLLLGMTQPAGPLSHRHHMTLRRLDRRDTARLSASILGEAGKLPEVVELVQRESEGNAFFVVEVARALIEITGDAARIGQITLPAQVFSGGIQQVVQRRLERVPDWAMTALSAAALVGRDVDLALIAVLSPDLDVDAWLDRCEAANVLSLADGVWQFSHDKVREAIVLKLSDLNRRHLHRRIAQAMEALWADGLPRGQHADILVYHWHEAGELRREMVYAVPAAQRMMEGGDYISAARLLERALTPQVQDLWDQAARARLERLLAEAYYAVNQMEESLAHIQSALRLLEMPAIVPDAINKQLAGQALRQVGHRVLPLVFRLPGRASREHLMEAALLHMRASQAHLFLGDVRGGFLSTMYALNLSERVPDSPILSFASAGLGYACSTVPALHGQARHYLRRAVRIAETLRPQHPESHDIAMTLHVASLALTGLGQTQRGLQHARTAGSLFDDLRDLRRWGESTAQQSFTLYFMGDWLAARDLREELYTRARRANVPRLMSWALAGMAQIALRMGNLQAAAAHLAERAYLLAQEQVGVSDTSTVATYESLLHWRSGDPEAARRSLALAMDELTHMGYTEIHNAFAYINAGEVAIHLWELTPQDDELAASARRLVGHLAQFAMVHPLLRARSLVLRGWLADISGQMDEAINRWKQAVRLGSRMGLPYSVALARQAMGRSVRLSIDERRRCLEQARQSYETLGAAYDVRRTATALDRLNLR